MRKKQKHLIGFFGVRIAWLGASCAVLFVATFFQTRILSGVHIGVIGVGGLTRQEAMNRVTNAFSEPRLTLAVGDRTWNISAKDLGANCDVASAVEKAFVAGRRSGLTDFVYRTVARSPITASCEWSDGTLHKRLTDIATVVGTPPQNATLAYRNGTFVVVPDHDGTVFGTQQFKDRVTAAVGAGKVVTVHLSPTVAKAEVTADDLNEPKRVAEGLLARQLTLTARGTQFRVQRDQLANWIIVQVLSKTDTKTVASLAPMVNGPKVTVGFDEAAMRAYLTSLAAQVDTLPLPQETLVSAHKVEVVKNGVPGSQLAVDEALSRLMQGMLDGLVDTFDLPVIEVPFPILYVDPPPAPVVTGKAIMVDLTKQQEYDYEDGALVYSTKISSGINDWTPTGTFKVLGKSLKQKMSGPGYYVPNVPHILWFKAGGYSIHGVYWHHDFGIRPRSHGCVGEPLAEAEWIFNWAEVGIPVVIYKS